MKISCISHQQWVILTVTGAIDSYTYPLFSKELDNVIRAGYRKVSLDLQQCSFLNISTLRYISKCHQKLYALGGLLTFIVEDQELIELLNMMCCQEITIAKSMGEIVAA
ncbi:MAG: STAS domain-containing protein [Bacteriovoracaceae bacterium]|nr:STAS domain-containing protein [Bacteriovoracaceae bacterium]